MRKMLKMFKHNKKKLPFGLGGKGMAMPGM
jgi:hypothetical protein